MAQGYQVYTQISGTLSLMPDSGNAASAWSNIKVRQAAEYAIDKAAIAKTFGFGFSTAADQWYPKGMLPYDPSIPGRKYDVAKAKTLLTEAGYPNGFKTKMIGDPTVNKDIVVALQAYLSAVGIGVTWNSWKPLSSAHIHWVPGITPFFAL
jgi:ABC-type transport system substrate-binding protein